MRHFLLSAGSLLALLLCTCGSAQAQHNLSYQQLNKFELEILPAQDNDALLRDELAQRRPGRARTFAVAIPTQYRPGNSGEWFTDGNEDVWILRLKSPGAKTLNLGFSEYNLPEGGRLYLTTNEEAIGPFTASDNAEHNELWTPIVGGDELVVELRVPTGKQKEVQLYLTFVNHDFEDVRQSLSGSCNLDVVCSDEDGWGIVDGYRDIIRSVAAYTLGGRDQCTGFLINNANEDGAPFFMTANHCAISPNNDQSVVTYWNFESPTCRQPGSTQSGQLGFGNRNIANSGAIFLAASANSDMALTRLEEPVNPAANPFYAGWSLEELAPTDTIIAVHHPGVDEKRISFTYSTVFRSAVNPFTESNTGRFLTVSQWDIGTTEGGSSGSPLFDRFKRVRGQLWRGAASCDNPTGYDQYGFFTASWEGDGTPETSIKGWLDPCGTGLTQMDGFDFTQVGAIVTTDDNCQQNCTSNNTSFELTLGNNFPNGTNISVVEGADGLTTSLSSTTAGPGETVTFTVEGGDIAVGIYTITLRATGGSVSDDITLTLDLFDAQAISPIILEPLDGATEVSLLTNFSWDPVANASDYEVQVSTTADFTGLVIDVDGIDNTILDIDGLLDPGTNYFYRVRANSLCGASPWRVAAFATSNQVCAQGVSTDLPLTISASGAPVVTATLDVAEAFDVGDLQVTVELDHSFIGDLSATLTSPDGTTIQLFTPPSNGGCGGDNMRVTFTPTAILTSADFNGACSTNDISIDGSYQPAESFGAFSTSSSVGTWTLRLTDGANQDGGQLNFFGIDVCSASGQVTDYSVQAQGNGLEACLNDPTGGSDLVLNLGASYDASTDVSVNIGFDELNNFTSTLDLDQGTLVLDFSNWNGLFSGNYTLDVEVTADGGIARQISVPLTLLAAAGASELNSPADMAELPEAAVTFNWSPDQNTESSTVEVSLTDDFASPIASETTTQNEVTIANLPAGGTLYWRVTSQNESCGGDVSNVRSFTFEGTSTRFFGEDRSLSIFPNPATDALTINLSGVWTDGLDGQLYDATGRRLRDYRVEGAGRTQWDVSALAQGVYFLRVQSGARQFTQRVVIR
ncbi:proprotein convertase P-domain-containing protein [Lewinella sp. 4G2]|uniref:proprotein convertase P-domain-containing protein n=1 Tax=Lewinella sp. 4G2 TaxID=1803372 RepID=UPI0007B4C0D3|nr:proprotein convertase P-domain-containing protein [Lewinella sp. 4G2]OAV43968.1 hypothetical protein A3850_005430 [Lewinella sp. 4G2]